MCRGEAVGLVSISGTPWRAPAYVDPRIRPELCWRRRSTEFLPRANRKAMTVRAGVSFIRLFCVDPLRAANISSPRTKPAAGRLACDSLPRLGNISGQGIYVYSINSMYTQYVNLHMLQQFRSFVGKEWRVLRKWSYNPLYLFRFILQMYHVRE